MVLLVRPLALVSLLLSGAIFGFFYAWICSTMWGLDTLPPNQAIAAMQAMNALVRNAVFAPAFFGTPFVLLLTAAVGWAAKARRASGFFAMAGLVYLLGGMILTVSVNVPMNLALADIALPLSETEALAIWQDYSGTWQTWNIVRTVFSGFSLALVGVGLFQLGTRNVVS